MAEFIEKIFYIFILILSMVMLFKPSIFLKLASQEVILLKNFKIDFGKATIFIRIWGVVCLLIVLFMLTFN